MKKHIPTLLICLILLVLVVLVYKPTFLWMIDRFDAEESSYSHGYLIPFVSAYLIWQRRDKLTSTPVTTSLWGLVVVAGALAVNFLAQWTRLHFVSGFSLPIVLAGGIIYLWGFGIARVVAFPLFFLVFMIPVPNVLLINVSFHLKLLVADMAVRATHLINIPAVQEGSTILLPNAELVVDYTCSGLRSLISLCALGTLFAYMLPTGSRLWKKIVLIASALPIAVIANMLRVFMMIVFTFIYGQGAAGKTFHDVSGYVVFAIAFALLMGVGKIIMMKPVSQRS